MSNATTTVVSDDGEGVVSELLHHLDLIRCGGSLRVRAVRRVARRRTAVAVTPEVGGHDREVSSQLRSDEMPFHVGLGKPVE